MTYIQASLNNGRISRWDKGDFPLPIYIGKSNWYATENDEYKYNDMVICALKEWETCSNGLVKFCVVNELYDSKVNLTWTRADKKSFGNCVYSLRQNRLYSAEIEIGLFSGIIRRRYLDDNEVFHTILHTLGLAVGLGHSNDKKDIMYVPHQYGITSISDNDIHTLEYIYNLPIGFSGKQFGEQFKIDSENFDEIVCILEKCNLDEKE